MTIKFLAVNTEWFPRHGGLSTFNRELCIALARAGNQVVCCVPRASKDEIENAAQFNVRLAVSLESPGLTDDNLLCVKPELDGFIPEVLIGHDRITGQFALLHRRISFPDSMVAIFIHTAPNEIEWFKTRSGSTHRADLREKAQMDIAMGADMIFPVGPRLYRDFATDMHESGKSIIRIDPGLRNGTGTHAMPPQVQILLLGRGEDQELKGLDIAAFAMGHLLKRPEHRHSILVVRGAAHGTGEKVKEELLGLASLSGDSVRVLEYTDDLALVSSDLRKASLLIMPSRVEGFGLVALEAIAEGVPVLVSAKSGIAEVMVTHLGDEADQFIVPVEGNGDVDGQEWARRIALVLEDRNSAGKKANLIRSKLTSILDWDITANKIVENMSKIKNGVG